MRYALMNVRKHSNLLSATPMRAWQRTSGHSITYDGDREGPHEERSDRGRPPRFSATQRRIGDPQRLPYQATPPSTSHSMAGTSDSRRQARRTQVGLHENLPSECRRFYARVKGMHYVRRGVRSLQSTTDIPSNSNKPSRMSPEAQT